MQTIDLHTHSTFSDGSCTPTEILRKAHEKGLAALSDPRSGVRLRISWEVHPSAGIYV